MKYLVIIKVDVNDADYVEKTTKIDSDILINLRSAAKKISEFKPYTVKISNSLSFTHKHNFPNGEYLRDDLGEKTPQEYYDFTLHEGCALEEIVPVLDYGFHTIESIKVLEISKEENLL